MPTALENRLESRNNRLAIIRGAHESLIAERGDSNLTEVDKKQIAVYREEQTELLQEIDDIEKDIAANERAEEASKRLHRARLDSVDGVDGDGDGVVYSDFLSYARDEILARSAHSNGDLSKLARQWGGEKAVEAAVARLQLLKRAEADGTLKRTPANTLSSNIGGLLPPQHISQIFQVINTDRPIVQSAQRTVLNNLVLNYPRVDTKPVVAVQASEKTEAGNTGLAVSMQSTTASTYLGGGDISWQAAKFSTPNALDLWFRIVTADYALKTEQDAAQVISHSGFSNNIASTIGATPTFADFMTAIGAGGAEVYANSGRTADTVYMAIDRYWLLFGTTSTAAAQFTTVSGGGVGPLRFVPSRGLDSGVIIVGDSQGLLVAEDADSPVELRVTEPAIGGFEVGLIGAFEAVVVDNGAFAMITTAS
jgi:HK97 family phage major capsid protein